MFDTLLDFVFPNRSLEAEFTAWVTRVEQGSAFLPPVRIERGALQQVGLRSLDRLTAACRYGEEPLVRRAVTALKYRRQRTFAEPLAAMVTHAVSEEVREMTLRYWQSSPQVLCPVPLHWSRRFLRGFNQAELLTRALSRRTALPCVPFLMRSRPTGHQTQRTHSERLHAVSGAFFVREDAFVPRHVILVDDIATSGATLDACARVLRHAGAHYVEAWVVAYAGR